MLYVLLLSLHHTHMHEYTNVQTQMFRPSGHPGFWFMGGNLALCRIYSKFLALQIKAIEEGLYSQSSQAQPIPKQDAKLNPKL